MKVYIARHGETNQAQELSEKGAAECNLVGRLLSKMSLNITQVCHSAKIRAAQTAEIFAHHLNVPTHLHSLLDPDRPLDLLATSLEDQTLYVGHLPTVGRLTSQLLFEQERPIIHFLPSTVVCISDALEWIITPELARLQWGMHVDS